MSVGIQSIYTFCVKMAPFNCCLFLHLLGLVHFFSSQIAILLSAFPFHSPSNFVSHLIKIKIKSQISLSGLTNCDKPKTHAMLQ